VFLGLGKQYEKGDWLVRFDTLQPALQAGLPPTGTYLPDEPAFLIGLFSASHQNQFVNGPSFFFVGCMPTQLWWIGPSFSRSC
jgi:hypothetical protein